MVVHTSSLLSLDFFPQVQKMMMNQDLGSSLSSTIFFSYCTQRRHVSCPRFNVIINKFSIIKINL